jgi:tRNA 2-selenouridine synthase
LSWLSAPLRSNQDGVLLNIKSDICSLKSQVLPQVQDIQQFLKGASTTFRVIDVRSPKEFEQGHIPGTVNIPLFDNEERSVIGTLYKKIGRQPAILKGMEIVGPKMANMVSQAIELAVDNTLYIHCWRGGMRSGFVAMLLEMYGIKVVLLKGGYKMFRRFALESFNEQTQINLLSGSTGSGKTYILKRIKEAGFPVIDLEGMAHHKGSAFGSLGEPPQPTQEQFENELAVQLFRLPKDAGIWMEDESRMIGKKVIPEGLWLQMRSTKVYFIKLSFEERLKHIVKEYGKFPKDQLRSSIEKITKRLGHEQAKNALIALENDDLETSLGICLQYYDKTYSHGISLREKSTIHEFNFEKLDVEHIARELTKDLDVVSNGRN